jgi:hypothetical protein
LDELDEEVKSIKRNSLKFAWYMRGGVSYEDVLNMSDEERTMISKIVEENLEVTKKTSMPFF